MTKKTDADETPEPAEKPVSLKPLRPDEALKGLFKVKPPEKRKTGKRADTKRKKQD